MEAVKKFVHEGGHSDCALEDAAANELLGACPFPELFALLATSDAEQQKLVLLALGRVYAAPGGLSHVRLTKVDLARGLAAGSPRVVREATARTLAALAPRASREIFDGGGGGELALALVAAVGGGGEDELEHVAVAASASAALTAALAAYPGSPLEVAPALLAAVERAYRSVGGGGGGAVALMRFADLMVSLATTTDGVFARAAAAGHLDCVVGLAQAEGDPLVQLNALDLVERLCGRPNHVAFLLRSGVADWLVLLATGESPGGPASGGKASGGGSLGPDPFLGGPALRLLGAMLASHAPTIPGPGRSAAPPPLESEASSAVGAVGRESPELLLRFLRAAVTFGGEGAEDSGSGRRPAEAQKRAAVDAVSTFAASSARHVRLVLADRALSAAWLSMAHLPADGKALVLHSLALVCDGVGGARRRGAAGRNALHAAHAELPQPPRAEDNAAFAGRPSDTASLAHLTPAAALPRPPPAERSAEPCAEEATEGAAAASEMCTAFGGLNVRGGGGGGGARGSWVAVLMGLLRTPVDEQRHGAFDLLRAAAASPGPWGLEDMAGAGGFFDFLENRFTEHCKAGKEWKFALIEAVVRNPASPSVPGVSARLNTLREMLVEGPFYVPWRPEGPEVV